MSNQSVTIPQPLNPGDTLTVTVGTPPPPTITGVSVSGPATLQENATAQFTAKVTGTGPFDPSVKWSCSDGTISPTGLFTAPAKVETVTIIATSVQDPTKSGQQPCSISNPTNTVQIQASGGDDTKALQAAINSTAAAGKILEMTTKGGKFQIGPVFDADNLNLLIDPQCLVSDIPGYGVTDCMFNFRSKNVRVTATGAFIQMPNSFAQTTKENNAGQDSEYRHCITVRGSNGLSITGRPTISQAGGDGVNLNSGTSISIDVVCNGCFRQGWSVTGGISGVTVSGGANNGPRAACTGFDFEPNQPGQSVTGVTINDFSTSNMGGGGMSFGFFNLGPNDKVDVTVNRYQSNNDKQGAIGFWNNNNKSGNATGQVTVNDSSVSGCQYAGAYGRKSSNGWIITFNNLKITNPNQGGADPHYGVNAAIGVAIDGGNDGQPGGTIWNNVTIQGGNGCMDIGDNPDNVKISGVCNGRSISFP